jgi:hypothetical protein
MRNQIWVIVFAVFMANTITGADFSVINTNNAGPGSLRQAILDANASPGSDRVVFEIPESGALVIKLTSALPSLSESVVVDGFSQPGSRSNELTNSDDAIRRIQLEGTGSFEGIRLAGGDSVVRGLVLRRFSVGVRLASSSNWVAGNYLGSEVGGTANGNGIGVVIDSVCCNLVGGTNVADRNVMAGNAGNSIRLTPTSGILPRSNQIKGNFLGVLSSGMAASASVGSSGISIDGGDGTVIGGLEVGARNIIAAGVGGVTIYSLTTNTLIAGNYIGVGSDGRTLLMRGQTAGVLVRQTTGSAVFPQRVWIEENVIANWSAGVGVSEPPFDLFPASFSSRVTISRNSIFYNFGGGIALGGYAETNDFLDSDVGANYRQNYPEITSAVFGGDTFIGGILESAPLLTYRVELFANSAGHISGFGEGETYLGFTNIVTDANGFASFAMRFSGVVPRQSYFTATATDADGNTSMFSRWFRGRALREPLYIGQPSSLSVLPYTNVVLLADVTGAAPLSLQWTKDGIPIAGATNLSLSLSNIVWEDRGSYVLVASNAFGVAPSETAEVTVLPEPVILVQPVGALVNPGTNYTFSVVAGGMLPIAYQWLWNGVAIPGATGRIADADER